LTDYSATIDWGDNSTSIGTITFNSTSGVFTVSGSHNYAEEGSYTISVIINHDSAPPARLTDFVTVSDQSVNATGGFTVRAFEGVNSGLQTVATFSDPAGAEPLTDYSASINWGDSSTSAGIITYDSNTGVFTVQGSHTYAEESSYPIAVTIFHDISSPVTVFSSTDMSVIATGGFTVNASEGADSGSQTVATFTDPNGPESVSNYFATINWGDGSTSPGTITFNSTSNVFTVSGSHTYAEEGNDTITVTIQNDTDGRTQVTSTANVVDASVVATGGFTVTAAEGSDSGSQTVATFTDPAGPEALTDYSANIAWGDGTTSSGTITFNSSNSTFTVSGNHTYAEEGSDSITVIIHHDAAADVSVTSTAQISDVAVLATGDFTLTAAEGASTGVQTVASFTDPAGPEPVANYSANISWGDGSSSAGTITFNSSTEVFTVSGAHAYAEQGSFAITVTIQHETAPAATASSSAVIRLVSDIAGRVQQGGEWWVGTSNGSNGFSNSLFTTWDPKITWVDVVTGDFNGDGLTDIAARDLHSGNWWVGISTGSSFTTTLWTTWAPNVTWTDVKVGDFTGDGKADIAGRALQTGHRWVVQSTGSSFTNSRWATWAPNVTWVDVQVGDFNGDGKADIAGRVLQSGSWWVAQSTGSSFANTLWTTWDPNVTWVDVRVGDFNGKDDIIGRASQSGQWWVGQSSGSNFNNSLWATWSTGFTWVDIQVGDFNGDGKADITSRAVESGQWWTGVSNGSSFNTSLWTTWAPNVTWADVRAGDFA
jgi:FG-GAP-like repeat